MNSVLVTGAAGLLGQQLTIKLAEKYSVTSVDIAENPFDPNLSILYKTVDLTNTSALMEVVNESAPEFIFNCAAYTDVDGCENDKKTAFSLNVKLVSDLLKTEFRRIIQFSTDYVFNGNDGPYSEDDPTDPVGYYGRTKLESEDLLRSSRRDFLVIRTNVLFGQGRNIKPNFITWLISRLRQNQKLRIVTDQYNNPIHAENLADAAIEAAEIGINGVLHVAGDSYLSRYQIAKRTAKHFGLDVDLLEAITTEDLGQVAKRPLKGGLKIDLAKSKLKTELLKFDKALELLKQPE